MDQYECEEKAGFFSFVPESPTDTEFVDFDKVEKDTKKMEKENAEEKNVRTFYFPEPVWNHIKDFHTIRWNEWSRYLGFNKYYSDPNWLIIYNYFK